MKACLKGLLLALSLVLLPAPAAAQSLATGTITGVVRDASGAVLPGVTVEASSPALIEKVRSAVTDGQGIYRITDLRPGTYSVTFSLTGFGTVRREGVELTTGFTARVNADLAVGSLEETITVSGAAPVVDTQNVTQQRVFAREVLENIPIATSVREFATLIPGAVTTAGSHDVGGGKGEFQNSFTIHGGRAGDFEQLRDGMYYGTMVAAGNWMSRLNPATVAETTVQTSGAGAELESGGILINIVPRDGGNTFGGTFNGSFSRPGLQSSNLNDELRTRGLTRGGPEVRVRYNAGGGFGGPIKEDRLWFFASARKERMSAIWPGNYFNKTPGTLFYEPDLSRPAYDSNWYNDVRGRITWQATSKDKIGATFANEWNCDCASTAAIGNSSPEAFAQWSTDPNLQGQVTWTRPHTSRLLLEAGATVVKGRLVSTLFGAGGEAGGSIEDRFVLDQSRNYGYGGIYSMGLNGGWGFQNFGQTNQKFSVSYVTGSHSAKVGVQYLYGLTSSEYGFPAALNGTTYVFNGRTPTAVRLWGAPHHTATGQQKWGFYAQDQWTIDRLTLNLGARFDYLNGYAPALDIPAGPWVPQRDFEKVTGIPNWKDWSPRIGAAYDLFGNGRTAIKGFVGRYVTFQNTGGITGANAPYGRLVTDAQRAWADANGDYVPQESELGPLSNRNFGTTVVTTTFSPDLLTGNRPYSWQGSLQLQHDLGRGVALSAGYFRTWYGNFYVTDNLALSPQDFDPYCITAPTHTLLPGGGGQAICGLYDVRPAKFGQTNLLVEPASKYGDQSDVFNGVDVSVTARFAGAGYVQAGLSTGATTTDRCYANDQPQLSPEGLGAGTPRTSEYCKVSPPWSGSTQFKAAVVMPLWWDIRASANYQNIAGISTPATAAIGNVAIARSLGRDLAACGARTGAACPSQVVVDVVLPNTNYLEPRLQQLDLRLTRVFRLGDRRIEPTVDFYNVLNSSAVRGVVTRLGPAYNFPFGILDPRLVKFGVNVTF